MSDVFRREYLATLPLPLAKLYSLAYNSKDVRARHNHTFYLFEALVKLLATPLVMAYVHERQQGTEGDDKIDRQLLQLARPSLGQWVGILRELAHYFGQRPTAAIHPLGHFWQQLQEPHRDKPGLLVLYQRIKNGPDAPPAGDQSCSILQVLDALVRYRNTVIGHGAERHASFYEEFGPLLFPAANEILAEETLQMLGPRGTRLVYLTDVRTAAEDRVEVSLRELVGSADGIRLDPLLLSREEARDLVPNRVAVLWPGWSVPLSLDPLLVFRERGAAVDVLFLNSDRGGRHVEYLSYTRGEPEKDPDMVPALAALLSTVAGQPITRERLEALGDQSIAESRSVEDLLAPLAPTAQVMGDYEVLAEIGRGAMGVVYLARQLSLGRIVALKMLPADLAGDEVALARFRREMRVLAACDHPHIVKVLASGQMTDGQFYYTMEYVPGADLENIWRELTHEYSQVGVSHLGSSSFIRAVLEASGKLRQQTQMRFRHVSRTDTAVDIHASPDALAPPDSVAAKPSSDAGAPAAERPSLPRLPLPRLPSFPSVVDDPGSYVYQVVMLMRDAALALQVVHDQQVIHRDVKPANLMLTPDGTRIVLMDFGLAKAQSLSLTVSRQGGFLGTMRYAAPEQFASATITVRPTADIRSLGVTMWELLTRRRLFAEAHDEQQLADCIFNHDVPRLCTIDPAFGPDLEAIVARATERRASDRIASAAQLAEYLQLYLDGKPLPIRPPSAAEMARRWMRKHRPLVASVATVVTTIFIAVTVAFVMITRARDAAIVARNEAVAARDNESVAHTEAEQQRDHAEQERKKLQAVNDFLISDMLAAANPTVAGKDAKVVDILEQAARTIPTRLEGQPALQANLHNTVGKTYLALGLEEKARGQFAKALEIAQQSLGEDHHDTLTSLNNLAVALNVMGDQEAAGRFAREAVSRATRLYGISSEFTLGWMNNLATVLGSQGKFAEAEQLLRQVLEYAPQALGEHHEITLKARVNLADNLFHEGHNAEALLIIQTLLQTSLRMHGPKHPYTLFLLRSTAELLREKGELEQAELLYRQALAGQRETLGEEHPDTLRTKEELVPLLSNQGRVEEARAMEGQLLEVYHRLYGDAHAKTLLLLNNVAVEYHMAGDFAQAEPFYRRVLIARREMLGEAHPNTLLTKNNLAVLLRDIGKFDEAELIFREVIEISEQIASTSNDTSSLLAIAYFSLAHTLQLKGEGKASLSPARRGFEISSQAHNAESWYHALASSILGAALTAHGIYAEAEPLLLAAVSPLYKQLGPNHRRMREAIQRVVNFYMQTNNPEKAEAYKVRLGITEHKP